MPKFKTGEDIVSAFEDAGYHILSDGRPYSDPDSRSILEKEIDIGDKTKNDIRVVVWEDAVEIIFPTLKRKNYAEQKTVSINYNSTDHGLVQSKIQSNTRRFRVF